LGKTDLSYYPLEYQYRERQLEAERQRLLAKGMPKTVTSQIYALETQPRDPLAVQKAAIPEYMGVPKKQEHPGPEFKGGVLAGVVGTVESYVRPEVPTVVGSSIRAFLERGAPRYELYPEYMRPPEKAEKHVPHDVPYPDAFKELKELGEGYIVGSVAGEIGQAALISELTGRRKVTRTKKVTKTTTYEIYGKEAMEEGIETIAKPETFRPTKITGRPSTIPSTLSRGAQQLILKQETAQLLVPISEKTVKLETIVKEVAKTRARYVTPMVGLATRTATLPKAWQRQPYPGTRQVRADQELYYGEAYSEPKPVSKHVQEWSDLYHKQRLLEKISGKLESAIGWSPQWIGTQPRLKPKSTTRVETLLDQETKLSQSEKQMQKQLQAQLQLPRFKPISKTRTVPKPKTHLPKRRRGKGKAGFLEGWFFREYGIRGPKELLKEMI